MDRVKRFSVNRKYAQYSPGKCEQSLATPAYFLWHRREQTGESI